MKTPINILIFPAGSEIGLEINNALKYSKIINVYGGSSVPDHSRYVYSKIIEDIPYYSSKNFIPDMNDILDRYNIDFIYPALDNVQLFLTEHADEIHAKIITPNLKTAEICRSKSKTYEYFSDCEFIPHVFTSTKDVQEYPIFVKPAVGCSAIGACIINSNDEFEHYCLENTEEIVIAEYLPGEEYTIDCFTDRHGQLRVVMPRIRSRIKGGISVNSIRVDSDSEIQNIAEIINSRLTFNGAWFFQLKKDILGRYKLLEISARIPGTMGVSRNCGVNFPLLTIYNYINVDVSLNINSYEIEVDRALISRYKLGIDYTTVYVDLDDTLILSNNQINTILLMFLYQCLNRGKKIILISKHERNISETLKSYHISEELFDEIIHIPKHERKTDYIKTLTSIFIDDSFSERRDVYETLHIPVFDVDMVESLIDWRI